MKKNVAQGQLFRLTKTSFGLIFAQAMALYIILRLGPRFFPGSGDILIPGTALRNRAVHGDVVAVQMLPKSEWRPKISRLAEMEKGEEGELGTFIRS